MGMEVPGSNQRQEEAAARPNSRPEVNEAEAALQSNFKVLTENVRFIDGLDENSSPEKLDKIAGAYDKAKGRINAAAAGAGLLAASETLLGYWGNSPSMEVTGLIVGGNLAAAIWMVGHGLNFAKAQAQEILSPSTTKN